MHVALVETEDGSNPLAATQAFQDFTRDIAERCDEGPAPLGATVVGSYRFPLEGADRG